MSGYNDIQVYSGRDLAVRQDGTEGFFRPPQTADGIMAGEQARAVAEVQAALVIAASRPRDELRSRDRLLQACQRIGLASSAVYQYSRGGASVSGPSIRLAETAARAWGNMNYGFRELSRRKGESDCEAFAWDLETNTKAIRQFSVRHWRDTKQGGYQLKDERDIYELLANQAQRRVRAAILEIIPGDIIEDAVAECERTMKAKLGGDIAVATKNLVEAFEKLGVTREQLEKRLGHRLDAIQPAQIINFRKIYTSIKDGMSAPEDWFESAANHAPPEQTTAKAPPAPAPKPRARKEKPAPEPEAEPEAEAEHETAPESNQETAPMPEPEATTLQLVPEGNEEESTTPDGTPNADLPEAEAAALTGSWRALYDALLERTRGNESAAGEMLQTLTGGRYSLGDIPDFTDFVCNNLLSRLRQDYPLPERK